MHVIVVDDERIILSVETAIIQKALPAGAEVYPFRSAKDALRHAEEYKIDIAFLDISIGEMGGIDLARRLQKSNPQVNIIFCTGYSEYALDAIGLYCSAYLLKPVSEENVREALDKLRFPVAAAPMTVPENRLRVRCFGNFEVFCGGKPVKFKYAKTKELFAYLVDRRGALLNTNEMMAALFEDEDKGSYLRNLKADLILTFQTLGVEDVLIQARGKLGVYPDRIECDYFAYLNGKRELFHGEYMSQYSFADVTLAGLLNA